MHFLVATKLILTYSHRTKMYDTGDLCQWNPSGTIPFLGPVDNQVKVKV
jgi:non-ribosomal peptide synthetase component F